jgi:hypothetical protein
VCGTHMAHATAVCGIHMAHATAVCGIHMWRMRTCPSMHMVATLGPRVTSMPYRVLMSLTLRWCVASEHNTGSCWGPGLLYIGRCVTFTAAFTVAVPTVAARWLYLLHGGCTYSIPTVAARSTVSVPRVAARSTRGVCCT